jgi:hypothetical protein
MATLLVNNSAIFDMVNGSTPRSVAVYTVPTGFNLILDELEIIPLASTGSGDLPTINVGVSGTTSQFNPTLNQNTFAYLSSTPNTPQIALAGTAIIGTIVTNATYSTMTGIIALRGYLVPSSGSIPNPPAPPSPSEFLATFYTVGIDGSPIAGITINYAIINPPDGNGCCFNGTPYSVTSDGTGLCSIAVTPGAKYTLWSGLLPPVNACIPADAESPYSLDNFIYSTLS